MGNDEPNLSSSSGGGDGSGSCSGGSTPSLSASPPASFPAVPVGAAAPFPVSFHSAAFPGASVPLSQHHQLLQQYQHQLQQQQRLFSLRLSPAATGSPPVPSVKHSPSGTPLSSGPPTLTHPPGSSTPSDRHLRDDCWSDGATVTLIRAWGDRYLELNRGNLKQKHWEDVADCVNRRGDGCKPPKTDIQCKNRLDTLKKKYKLEKSKIITSGGTSKWAFFDSLDELIGPSKKPRKSFPLKLRSSPPRAPSSINVLPLKRLHEEPNQRPQLQPPLPPLTSTADCVSPALNHATLTPLTAGNPETLNHISGTHNQGAGAPNPHSSFPNHTLSVPSHDHSPPKFVLKPGDDACKSDGSPRTTGSRPNGENAQPRRSKRKRPHADPMQELGQAIVKLGEVYERTEIARQRTLSELEKQRIIFAKDLELQRLQFFMQAQVELAKLKHTYKHGNPGDH
ncbi:hypothetical protein KP509_38G051400 [Ceratopteris richardii]|uniref:Myb/SANT-like DNA-binding domain-containing protein n=1 Tax=Ceratopteris richardii TaxID=49495 RepID=A0A8T2Q4R8_CERRI|nr:hypothetical protein KP509_38G051400 [Ceratopteris richardii]